MHEALDRLVQRDPSAGQWLDGKVPTASALADGSLRYFVQRWPAIVVVTPKETLESAQRFPLARWHAPHKLGARRLSRAHGALAAKFFGTLT